MYCISFAQSISGRGHFSKFQSSFFSEYEFLLDLLFLSHRQTTQFQRRYDIRCFTVSQRWTKSCFYSVDGVLGACQTSTWELFLRKWLTAKCRWLVREKALSRLFHRVQNTSLFRTTFHAHLDVNLLGVACSAFTVLTIGSVKLILFQCMAQSLSFNNYNLTYKVL